MLRSAVRSRLAPPDLPGKTLVSPSSSRPRTPPFHGGNRGSNPLGDAIFIKWPALRGLFYEYRIGKARVKNPGANSKTKIYSQIQQPGFDQFVWNELAARVARSEGPSAGMHEPIPLGTPYSKNKRPQGLLFLNMRRQGRIQNPGANSNSNIYSQAQQPGFDQFVCRPPAGCRTGMCGMNPPAPCHSRESGGPTYRNLPIAGTNRSHR